MSENIYYLEQYPFDETAEKCENYISSFDWREISDDIKEKKVIHFDVSDCIDIFEHLQLDDDYSVFSLGYPHKSVLESETDEYEIFYTIDVDEEQFKKENVGVAIDFYNRFCWILQLMMEHNPDNEFISFMGP